MIDGVGKGGAGPDRRRAPEKGAAVGAGRAATGPRAAEGAVKSAVFELVSGGAPVDTSKVAAVRAAIAEGRYPIDPTASPSACSRSICPGAADEPRHSRSLWPVRTRR